VIITEIAFTHNPRGAVYRLKKIAHFLLSFRLVLTVATFAISILGLSKFVSGGLAKIGFWDVSDGAAQDLPRNYTTTDERIGVLLEWIKS
jgi:hypothetical protein